jgi:hypothetical protein
MLLAARTDTAWWHDDVMRAATVHLIRGRLRFEIHGVPMGPAPFPSAIVTFMRGRHNTQFFTMEGRSDG